MIKMIFFRLENFSMKNWFEDIVVDLTGAFLCTAIPMDCGRLVMKLINAMDLNI